MSVLVVGLNHRSADFALLEQLAVPAEDIPKTLASLLQLEHVLEAVVLSTCNRVEIYANVSRFHPGFQELRGWVAERVTMSPDQLDDVAYCYYDEQAAEHLFAVAAGIDSMVVGEQQIRVQVKQAAETARDEGSCRRVLGKLFNQAVRTGRRVRNETDIATGASSIVDVGLDIAGEQLTDGIRDGFRGRTILVVGAGKMGGLTVARLLDEDAGTILVWNRSRDKAERLAARVEGTVVEDDGLPAAIAAADLVVCTTGAPEPILDAATVAGAVAARGEAAAGQPLVLLDLAMPRNVDPACAELPEVSMIDIADVREVADRTVTGEVIADARAIIADEAARFVAWTHAVKVEPTIRSLRQRAEQVRTSELDRLGAKLAGLDERERAAVDALSRGIIQTLLHEPSVRLKDLADRGGAEAYTNALRELFDLDE